MFYRGRCYTQDRVSIGPFDPALPQFASVASDVREPARHWVSESAGREDILYFSIFLGKELSGQILLHDLNTQTWESLVAFHLFSTQIRGQGIGTQAIRLLQSYVMSQTVLRKLVIITSRDNLASQRIAQKCGFQYVGSSREDPVNEMVFEWLVP